MGMLALLLACLLLASPMSAAHAGDAKTASSSRDVWLKRAQSNADAFMTGMASWYGADFHNKKTASGEGYDMYTFTAAHRTLPIGTVVRVTDKSNGKSVMVCVTDRGPYVRLVRTYWSFAKKRILSIKSKISNLIKRHWR